MFRPSSSWELAQSCWRACKAQCAACVPLSRGSAALTSWKYKTSFCVTESIASSDTIAEQLLATSKAEFQVVMTPKQTNGIGQEETSFGSFPTAGRSGRICNSCFLSKVLYAAKQHHMAFWAGLASIRALRSYRELQVGGT